MARYEDEDEQSRSVQQLYAATESGARNSQNGLWINAPDTLTSSSAVASATTATNSTATTVTVRGYFEKTEPTLPRTSGRHRMITSTTTGAHKATSMLTQEMRVPSEAAGKLP